MTRAERLFLKQASEGVFLIADDGSIWRLKSRQGRWGFWHDIKPRKVGTPHHKNGYTVVCISDNHWNGAALAHRLVYAYFCGDIPEGYEVNHRNGVRNDNRLSNLELVTHSDNMALAKAARGGRRRDER